MNGLPYSKLCTACLTLVFGAPFKKGARGDLLQFGSVHQYWDLLHPGCRCSSFL